MTISWIIKTGFFKRLELLSEKIPWLRICFVLSVILSLGAIVFCYYNGTIVAYGDAESHLNIAKRVVHSLTPGMAQLGGIWLPLPHILMIPFVYFDVLWRTGLAGSIVSGTSFVVSAIFIFKLAKLLIKSNVASFLAFLAFATNPNILYMQATPMTELPLIVFLVLSTYFFLSYVQNRSDLLSLIKAAFFGLCASLSRYDGWFFVIFESMLVCLLNLQVNAIANYIKLGKISELRKHFSKAEGITILFATMAFLGIVLWIGWDALILKDPFYFTSSQFSANSQQQGWLLKKQLPSYHNILSAISYYTVTSASSAGILVFGVGVLGLLTLLLNKKEQSRWWTVAILLIPYFFYVLTLYAGQSMIFIPHLTPITFEWTLFNVRYGVMMVPVMAIFFAYLFSRVKTMGKVLIIFLLMLQYGFYAIGYSKVMAYQDATVGLSANKHPDAEGWLAKNYDYGLVLMDDYKRIFSLINTNIPMQKVVYIGNKPYWEESLKAPETYVRWVVIQKGDTIWDTFYSTPQQQGRFYKYYKKLYTSEDILIFRLSDDYKPKII